MPKFPKKVREIFQLIRRGDVKKGLAALDAVEGFELEKNVARAEVAYFELDWRKGYDLTKTYLAHTEAFHYSNIFEEHLALLLRATGELGAWKESESFVKELLKFYADAIKGVKDQSVFTFQCKMALGQIKKRASITKMMEEDPFVVRMTGKSLEEIEKQQAEVKPKLSAKGKERERARYILFFLAEYGKSADYLALYERFAKQLDFADHTHAAMEYAARGKKKQAQEAILRCASAWWPVEPHQVEPIELLLEPTLKPYLDKKLCAEILKMSKGPDTV